MSEAAGGADLGLLMRQVNELLFEMRIMRDDMGVLAAVVQRMDGTLAGLVSEIRATRTPFSRMDRRVRSLEAGQPASLP